MRRITVDDHAFAVAEARVLKDLRRLTLSRCHRCRLQETAEDIALQPFV